MYYNSRDLNCVELTYKARGIPYLVRYVAAATLLLSAAHAMALEEPPRNDDILLDTYRRIEARLVRNSFGSPLYLESSDEGGRLHVDVYGIFDHSFSSILDVLKAPANWCDIALLHPNVKTCTYRELPDSWRLTFYIGRKVFYQSPADTHQYSYQYRSVEQRQDYLDIVLSAADGPFGTKNHRMRFEASPLEDGRTFVHVSYTYFHNFSVRLASLLYFATLGHGKAGFTVDGTDSSGNPVYISGPRGAMERNAVRYYFAIQSFMDTLHYPEESRFTMRVRQWHNLTSRFRKQLFDLEKKDYLAIKTAEHRNQVLLQQGIAANLE